MNKTSSVPDVQKIIRCVVKECKYNSFCKGCSGKTSKHPRSDMFCQNKPSAWVQLNKDLIDFFKKVSYNDPCRNEKLQLCDNHQQFSENFAELSESIWRKQEKKYGESLDRLLIMLRKYRECRKIISDLCKPLCEIIKAKAKSNIRSIQEKEIVRKNVKCIQHFCMDAEIKREISDSDLHNYLFMIMEGSQEAVKETKEDREMCTVILQLLVSFMTQVTYSYEFSQQLYDYCMDLFEIDDLDLHFQLVSCFWALSFTFNFTSQLKENMYYFIKNFNIDYSNMDLQLQENYIGFVAMVFKGQITTQMKNDSFFLTHEQEKNDGHMVLKEFLRIIEGNRDFYSPKIAYLINKLK